MEETKDTLSTKTVSDLSDQMMADEEDGKEFTLEYYKARFLSSIGRSLYYARRQAGLTQTQIAEHLNTTQSAIARLEADKNGAVSFHRYADFVIACGLMPRSLVLHTILEPIALLREEALARASAQHSQEPPNIEHIHSTPTSIHDSFRAWVTSNATALTSLTPLTNQDVKAAIETAQNIVRQSQQQYRGNNATSTSTGHQTSTVANNERLVFV